MLNKIWNEKESEEALDNKFNFWSGKYNNKHHYYRCA